MRRMGMVLTISSTGAPSIISVPISPGAMQLTVISRLASSTASALVAPTMPAFAAQSRERRLGAGAIAAIMSDDGEAVAGEAHRDGATDSLAGAGDKDGSAHDPSMPVAAESCSGSG